MVSRREHHHRPIDTAPVLARGLADARIVLLPRCGHWPQVEQPDVFARAVRIFLEEKQASEIA
jgi:pimeloyl-ACP methyl ester carboxylesterase